MAAVGIKKVREILAARPDRHNTSLADRRAAMDAMGGRGKLPPNVDLKVMELGGIGCECIATKGVTQTNSILYVHGGAYVAGSPRSHRGLGIVLSEEVGAPVFMLDYGLAPECPFPAAVLDVVSAYREMRQRPDEFGAIALVGDSAGGGALISALTVLRDAGDPLPSAVACISPWLDLSCSFDSYTRLADTDPFLSKSGLLQDASLYLAGADPKNPLASPVYADLTGLPPMLIQVGSEEVLIDEINTFVDAGKLAGCHITLQVWPDMIHVFHAFRALLPDAVAATSQLAEFINSKFE